MSLENSPERFPISEINGKSKNELRYFMRLSFNGRDFHGWQIQQNANSIQQEVNNALSLLLRKNIETIGCGRTDTGVHAENFFLHFDFNKLENIPDIIHQLNAILSPSIAIHSIFQVADDAHARFSATSRTYQYKIYQKKNPFKRELAYFFSPSIDIEKMNSIAVLLYKQKDFSAFSKAHTQTFTNNCSISLAIFEEGKNEIVFTITADRFLRNMVRAIVGTLLQVGMNKINEKEFLSIMDSGNRSEAGVSVPAHGLYLTEISYPFPLF